jgi:hypothetical protein
MATNTYVALATQTLSTTATSVTFSSIPQGYTDLILVASIRSDTVTYNNMNFPILRFNGDSTSGLYSVTSLYSRNTGGGDTANSTRSSSQNEINFGGVVTTSMSASTFSPWIAHLLNYSNTTTNKTVLNRIASASNLTTSDGTSAGVGLWRNTAAITSISLTATSSGNFVTGSTFSLYGIASSGAGAKATGGTVTSDSQYYYHTFAASGTFTPTQSISADVLVVAGGGGGGTSATSGGGGAGGLVAYSSQSLTAIAYTCTIGSGGASGASPGGTTGSNSQFGSLTASAGGGGGGTTNQVGKAGGSGGGGGGGASAGAGGSATSGQGFAGGAGYAPGSDQQGGGGGGAGAVGQAGLGAGSGSPQTGGNGGIGATSTFINTIGAATGFGQLVSSNYYFAGGGGGHFAGAGGSGGGGGGTDTALIAGFANTGGGGKGGGSSLAAAGGSGIVIVRYAK